MLLVPIGFGMLIGNVPFNTEAGLEIGIYEEGSVLNILYTDGHSRVMRTLPSRTESPVLIAMDAILPSRPAWMAFSIFMASSITTVSDALTVSPTFTGMLRTTPHAADRLSHS